MKLTTAINKLNTAGFELIEITEDRLYKAVKKGKETIEINADSTETVYSTYYVWENDKVFVKNLSQAIKFAWNKDWISALVR